MSPKVYLVPAALGTLTIYENDNFPYDKDRYFAKEPVIAWQIRATGDYEDYILTPISVEGLFTNCCGVQHPNGSVEIFADNFYSSLFELNDICRQEYTESLKENE